MGSLEDDLRKHLRNIDEHQQHIDNLVVAITDMFESYNTEIKIVEQILECVLENLRNPYRDLL